MLFTTFPQLIALLVLFVAGLILGLGLHPGGGKWKKRFKDESDNYAAFRREADKAQRDSNQRIRDLEAELATAREQAAARPDGRPDGRRADPETYVTTPAPMVAASAARPAVDGDLTRIRGIDAPLARRLNDLGVTRFEDIEAFTPEDEMALEQRLGIPAGYIAREQWREQAHVLRTGRDGEHSERFPAR
jgi:predicted flap endonuclease-1-like 5' DNA nuclease